MSIETTINCDALNCFKSIDSTGTDTIEQFLAMHNWHHDADTEEYQYCSECHLIIEAEQEADKKFLAERKS